MENITLETPAASGLDWLGGHYHTVYVTEVYCRFCESLIYWGELPKEADQHLPESMFACQCARFTTDLFSIPFTEKQWTDRVEPLQAHRNKNLLGENSQAKSPAKRKAKRRDKSATEPDSQAPVTVAAEVPLGSTNFASEADSINQMYGDLVGLGLSMLERMFQIGEQLSRIKNQLPHGSWEQWVDDHLKFTARAARRYIRAYKHRLDPLALSDPVLFLEEIQGKAEPKSDTKSRSDTGVRSDGEPNRLMMGERKNLPSAGGWENPTNTPGIHPPEINERDRKRKSRPSQSSQTLDARRYGRARSHRAINRSSGAI